VQKLLLKKTLHLLILKTINIVKFLFTTLFSLVMHKKIHFHLKYNIFFKNLNFFIFKILNNKQHDESGDATATVTSCNADLRNLNIL